MLSISFVALLWSGRGIAGESLRNLKFVVEHIVICSIHTDIAVFILVSYMVAELVAETSRRHGVQRSRSMACDMSMVCQFGKEIR